MKRSLVEEYSNPLDELLLRNEHEILSLRGQTKRVA